MYTARWSLCVRQWSVWSTTKSYMRNSIGQDTSITQAHHCYFPLPWVAPDLVVGFAGCGIIVISSLIFNGFRSESFDLDDGDAGAFFLSITLFATTLCAEYTWFSNCLYIPNVAVQTVHLYDRCAGFNVIPWSRATWFNNFHWYTLPQAGQRPASFPLFAASCMLDVTSPWDPNKCLSKPWSVKNRNWHFWQFNGGLL